MELVRSQSRISRQGAPVSFSGLAPGYAGLYQINLTVPANVDSGVQDLSVTAGGVLRVFLFLLVAGTAFSQPPEGTMAITLSMEHPATHYYHVVFRTEGLKGDAQDFKLPAWTPGYYRIMDYSKNLVNFRASDGAGHALAWSKTAKNTWHIASHNAESITVSYDVYAFNPFVAESFLDDTRGYITPASIFLHVAGRIQHPVTLDIQPYAGWSKVSIGLDPMEGRPNTFSAPDFDLLYDCPILMGNQEVRGFEVQGVPHALVFENVPNVDHAKITADLKRMVEAAVGIIGEIPYRHYTFLAMGVGGGGIEHLTSTAMMFNGTTLSDPAGYSRWLSFVAHEYFHTYNVKRIRPIALGPFDYDKENYTDMLWVSEGFTVYYEDLILVRAGLMTRDQYFERVQKNIQHYENSPGHLLQSAAEASFDTWIKGMNRGEYFSNTTISYYDKGAALGLLLDLKIRNETQNRRSLDDVMRALYQKYYKERKRGFTDEEFREECDSAAGVPLTEVFEYATTVADIDYRKYFAYGGLEIDVDPVAQAGAFLGADTQFQDGNLVISSVEGDSPAQRGGLMAQDQILALNGTRVNVKSLDETLKLKKAGDKIRVLLSRRGTIRELDVVLGQKMERNFQVKAKANPSAIQAAILEDWLRQR
jgi:predicted metalloprotease with PDZ domain